MAAHVAAEHESSEHKPTPHKDCAGDCVGLVHEMLRVGLSIDADARVFLRIVNDVAVFDRNGWYSMTNEFLLALLLLAIVVVWVIAKVVGYMRLSERQWRNVDKSKLKRWDDEED